MLPFARISQYGNTVLPSITGVFTSVNTSGGTRYSFGNAYDSGTKLYAFDGYNGANMNSFVVYDTSTNVLTTLSTGSIAARHAPGLVYYNNKIYMFGGYTSAATNDFYVYDVSTNTWTANTTSTNKPSARHHCRFRATDAGILYLWGSDNGNQLYSYNPSTNAWTALAGSPASNVVSGDMCTDGVDLYCSTSTNTALMKYTVSTGTWSTISMNSGVYGRLVYINNAIYTILNSILYKFVFDTNTWVQVKTGIPNLNSGAFLTNTKTGSAFYSLFGSIGGTATNIIYKIT